MDGVGESTFVQNPSDLARELLPFFFFFFYSHGFLEMLSLSLSLSSSVFEFIGRDKLLFIFWGVDGPYVKPMQ